MARELMVRVKGARGLDDAQVLRNELEDATGLEWRVESVPEQEHLSGITEIVLGAVLGKTTELVYGVMWEKVRERVEQWRGRYLDKPEYEITELDVAEAETEAGAEAGKTPTPES